MINGWVAVVAALAWTLSRRGNDQRMGDSRKRCLLACYDGGGQCSNRTAGQKAG